MRQFTLIIFIFFFTESFANEPKIKIKLNGKTKIVNNNLIIDRFLKKLRIPIKKVAIELNNEILDKKKLNKIKLNKDDKIEIVHFIGGG